MNCLLMKPVRATSNHHLTLFQSWMMFHPIIFINYCSVFWIKRIKLSMVYQWNALTSATFEVVLRVVGLVANCTCIKYKPVTTQQMLFPETNVDSKIDSTMVVKAVKVEEWHLQWKKTQLVIFWWNWVHNVQLTMIFTDITYSRILLHQRRSNY